MERPETPFIDAARPGRRVGHAVEVHDVIGSTNDRARQLLDDDAGPGTAVVAELQTQGRGRRGRAWASPAGVNLMVSVAYRPRLEASEAWRIGIAAALAACDACRAVAPVDLKWPNDLVGADGRKVGGLLVETAIDGDRVTSAVIGAGINVNWPIAEMPEAIAGSATSLLELSRATVDRGALLARLLDRLDAELLAVESGTAPLDRYRAACRTIGSHVVVEVGDRVLEGIAIGIDDRGALVVETASGTETISSGEVVRVRAARPAVPA